MTELPFIDPVEGARALILKWIDSGAVDLSWEGQSAVLAAGDHVGELPDAGIGERLPFIALDLVGGGQDYFEDHPFIAIDVFTNRRGGGKARAKKIAAGISLAFLRYPDSVVVGERIFQIDSATSVQSPMAVPWGDENIRRITARYELSVRR